MHLEIETTLDLGDLGETYALVEAEVIDNEVYLLSVKAFLCSETREVLPALTDVAKNYYREVVWHEYEKALLNGEPEASRQEQIYDSHKAEGMWAK